MVTAKQIANIESEVLSSGFPVEALMEKVGEKMAGWFVQHSELSEFGVVVIVGPGYNGGDGLVVARELYSAGVSVEIWCPLLINKSLTANLLSYAKWLGIPLLQEPPALNGKALWVDALFGISQSRPLPDLIANLFNQRQQIMPGRIVSLDVPSGICSDSGIPFAGGAAVASFTLTVGLIKQGLIQDMAMPYVGHLVRIDLGLPPKVFDELPNSLSLAISSEDLKDVSWPVLPLAANKYQRGRILVVAGSDEYRGAAWLALKGAIASGVGSIQALLPNQVANDLWQVAPEIVLAGGFDSFSDGVALGGLLLEQDVSRFDAVLIGPGLENIVENWEEISDLLQLFDGLLVLDAEALNRIALCPEGWQWLGKRKGPTWITPHLAEFRRLFPTINNSSLLDSARQAAQLSGTGVLLKGAHSVVADPKGISWQLKDTSSFVARTGLGDLLAGFVVGVGALGMASNKPISCELLAIAAFVHAEAAKSCEKGSSPSFIAEKLAELTKTIQVKGVLGI